MSMHTELTNLVPQQTVKTFRRNYFFRLATVTTFLLCAFVVINALLLLPSYLYAQEEVRTETAQLNKVANSTATAEEQSAQTQLSNLQSEATYLSKLSNVPTSSAVIRAILAVPHDGIKLNGFEYTAPTPAVPNGTLDITGVAATRDALRSYDSALSALPFVTSANLPISDYANDSNISFDVTLTGPLNP